MGTVETVIFISAEAEFLKTLPAIIALVFVNGHGHLLFDIFFKIKEAQAVPIFKKL